MTTAKALTAEPLDNLLSGYQKPEDLIGENGPLKQFTKVPVETTDHPATQDRMPGTRAHKHSEAV